MVLHAGGVIRDAPLSKQTMSKLRETLKPKWDAARQLTALHWARPIVAESSFSSLSALLGTAGQANYAAANMALNVLSQQNQSRGVWFSSLKFHGLAAMSFQGVQMWKATQGILCPYQPKAIAGLGGFLCVQITDQPCTGCRVSLFTSPLSNPIQVVPGSKT